MSGGASFNEVFFNDVRVADSMRLGDVGEGWRVALTTLGFERDRSGEAQTGAGRRQLGAAARHRQGDGRQRATRSSGNDWRRLHPRAHRDLLNRAAGDRIRAGATPGPEGSLGKLLWTNGMTLVLRRRQSQILGPPWSPTRGVGNVRVGRARPRRARIPDRRRLGRDPAQHHRRARARTCRPSRASTRTSPWRRDPTLMNRPPPPGLARSVTACSPGPTTILG